MSSKNFRNNAVVSVTLFVLFAFILLSPSTTFIQNASAAFVASEITSAKSDSSDIANAGFITLHTTSSVLTFEFKGFDDDNHIVELRCSFDGTNYLKSTCPSQSAESQSTFAGPDGVVRTYNVKTGSVSVKVTPTIVPVSHFFGVKAFNDNNNLSPAATITFKMRSTAVGGTGGPSNETGVVPAKVTVKFDSITILDSRDPSVENFNGTETQLPGDWFLTAYVQGKKILLLDGTVHAGQTINFKPGTEATVQLADYMPLSIFTVGIEEDCDSIIEYFAILPEFLADFPAGGFHAGPYEPNEISELYKRLYSDPNLDWKDEINALQYKLGGDLIRSECYDPNNRLGTINELYSPPNYKPIPPTFTPEMLGNILGNITEPLRTHIINALNHPSESTYITSSLKDFILKYTITVAP